MKILRSQECNITQEIEKLNQGMSIFADTVTKGMEAKTKEVFGEPLSPSESARRVIDDVIEKGDEALEYYSEKFEGVSLSAENIKIKTAIGQYLFPDITKNGITTSEAYFTNSTDNKKVFSPSFLINISVLIRKLMDTSKMIR